MRVRVGPAKRQGGEKTILNQSLQRIDLDLDGDEVRLSFCAEGIYDCKSQYRYTMQFSRSEMLALLSAEDAARG